MLTETITLKLPEKLAQDLSATSEVIEVLAQVLTAYSPPVILDYGETELLAFAQTLSEPLVLLDDEVARTEARRLHLRVRGTLGVLVQAYQQGLLSFSQINLLFQEIGARQDILISAKLCQHILNALSKVEINNSIAVALER